MVLPVGGHQMVKHVASFLFALLVVPCCFPPFLVGIPQR